MPGVRTLPEVTGPELAEHLDAPRALAAVQAAKLRGEAGALQDQMLAKHLEADRVLHLASLEDRRSRAQAELEVAVAQRREKTAPLKAAQRAEAKAAAELEKARGEHADVGKAEETARRMRAGVSAETEAALRLRLRLATDVLARYEREHAQAVAVRDAAQRDLDAAADRVTQMEAARDTVARAVAEPGRVPVSLETLSADLLRLLVSGALDPVEVTMARVPVEWLAGVTGYAAALEADTRRRQRDEDEESARTPPVVLQQGRTGVVTAMGNPFAPGIPRQRGVGPVGDGILQTPGLGGL